VAIFVVHGSSLQCGFFLTSATDRWELHWLVPSPSHIHWPTTLMSDLHQIKKLENLNPIIVNTKNNSNLHLKLASFIITPTQFLFATAVKPYSYPCPVPSHLKVSAEVLEDSLMIKRILPALFLVSSYFQCYRSSSRKLFRMYLVSWFLIANVLLKFAPPPDALNFDWLAKLNPWLERNRYNIQLIWS